MYDGTLVASTGQSWKIYVSWCFIVVGGGSMMSAAFLPAVHHYDGLFEILLFGGFILLFSGGALLTRGIRCPICNCPFVWSQMKTLEFSQWLNDAFQSTVCPNCGLRARANKDL